MKPILILYATREGQTQRIAEFLSVQLRRKGLRGDIINVRRLPPDFSLNDYSSTIVAASVHYGEHEPEMVKFVKNYRQDLQQLPTAFLSVSLSQAGAQDPGASEEQRRQAAADVKTMINSFLTETRWHPGRVLAVAGALMYLKCDFFLRFIMKRIARQAGASTDTSCNHEFTDWSSLDEVLGEFVADEMLCQGALAA